MIIFSYYTLLFAKKNVISQIEIRVTIKDIKKYYEYFL